MRKRTKFFEAKTVVTFNASAPRQSNLGSFLLTRPDRVSGLVLYRTSKVGREPQGESLARGSSGARAECGGVLRKRTKFFEAKTVVTFNASAPRQSNLGSFLLTRPDRVSGLVLYRTSKVGREPQGESLA